MQTTARLGEKAARGAALLSAVALLSRMSGFVGQLVLAWFLMPEEFGLFATAISMTAIGQVITQAGLREVLIQHPARLRLWARSATRLALLLSLIAWFALTIFALLASWGEGREGLRWILPLVGLAWPLHSLGLVPEARLASGLAFGKSSRVTLATQASTTTMQILLAWAGLGALSLVLPVVINAGLRSILFRRAAGPLESPPKRTSLRRTIRLLSRSRWSVLASLLVMVWMSGDYLLLGSRFSSEEVGQYYFGFVLATATMTLFSGSVSQVLFPSLVQLRMDPSRQWSASYAALRVLAVLGFPFCALQVLLGVPFLQFMYGGKWSVAEVIFATLSVGMAFRLVGSSAGSLLMAQGRFKYQAGLSASFALLFLLLTSIGLMTGSLTATVALISIFYVLVGPLNIWATGKRYGASWMDVVRIFMRPLLLTFVALVLSMAPERVLDLSGMATFLVRGIVFTAVCLSSWWIFHRDDLSRLLTQIFRRRAY